MSDITIPALLGELNEVDFETWKDIKFLLSNMMLWPEPNGQPLEQNAYQDIIQGGIQRAIHEQKCALQQFHFMGSADYCNAAIFSIRGMIAEGNGATPTTAILAAYIEAKRVMR